MQILPGISDPRISTVEAKDIVSNLKLILLEFNQAMGYSQNVPCSKMHAAIDYCLPKKLIIVCLKGSSINFCCKSIVVVYLIFWVWPL